MSSDTLRIANLRLGFERFGNMTEVLRGVHLRVRPGSVVALVGESGSGKSVTANAVMGLLPRNARILDGTIQFHERRSDSVTDLAALDPSGAQFGSFRGSSISMIFQEPMSSLSPIHTVGDQVGEAYSTHVRASRAETRERTLDLLAEVGFPEPVRVIDMYPFELSGGMRQRAMIAMALICEPELLIADEPTTALDVTVQAQILKLLKDIRRHHDTAMLLITHDLGVVANMADEVVVMYHGEVMEAGPTEAIFRNPQHAYLKMLMAAVPTTDRDPEARLVSLREARTAPAQERSQSSATPCADAALAGGNLLEIERLTKTFTINKGRFLGGGTERKATAVDNLSLVVRRGECLGLVGESGCGKSTLSKLIMRAIRPDSGRITLAGGQHGDIDVATCSDKMLKDIRTRVQMVFQDPVNSLSPRMTVLNILSEPLEIAGVGTKQSRRDMCVELMKTVGLDPRFLSRYPHSFSGGQRQRIGIARALALTPELLILDEPVSALDVSVQAQILNLLNDLRTERGLTYLFISHNLAVVHYVAQRIAVMARGRIVEVGTRDAIFRNAVHPYTRALLSAVPFADLDRPIDFDALKDNDASDPAEWGAAFSPGDQDADLTYRDIEPGHTVLMRTSALDKEHPWAAAI